MSDSLIATILSNLRALEAKQLPAVACSPPSYLMAVIEGLYDVCVGPALCAHGCRAWCVVAPPSVRDSRVHEDIPAAMAAVLSIAAKLQDTQERTIQLAPVVQAVEGWLEASCARALRPRDPLVVRASAMEIHIAQLLHFDLELVTPMAFVDLFISDDPLAANAAFLQDAPPTPVARMSSLPRRDDSSGGSGSAGTRAHNSESRSQPAQTASQAWHRGPPC